MLAINSVNELDLNQPFRLGTNRTEPWSRLNTPVKVQAALYNVFQGDYNLVWGEKAAQAFSPILFLPPFGGGSDHGSADLLVTGRA